MGLKWGGMAQKVGKGGSDPKMDNTFIWRTFWVLQLWPKVRNPKMDFDFFLSYQVSNPYGVKRTKQGSGGKGGGFSALKIIP